MLHWDLAFQRNRRVPTSGRPARALSRGLPASPYRPNLPYGSGCRTRFRTALATWPGWRALGTRFVAWENGRRLLSLPTNLDGYKTGPFFSVADECTGRFSRYPLIHKDWQQELAVRGWVLL